MRSDPIVILSANQVPVEERQPHCLTVADLVQHKVTSTYVYKKCIVALQRFKVWDTITQSFKSITGSVKLRWFTSDRDRGYPLLNIHSNPHTQ